MKLIYFLIANIFVGLTCFSPVSAKEYKKVALLPDQMVLSTAWTQSSAEYKALTKQIYNMSKVILDMHLLTQASSPKPIAIILDLDETLLDNSPYQAMTVSQQTGFPNGWFDWVDAAEAEAVPGALDFLHYADKKGVQIFYLSNRKEREDGQGLRSTLKNIQNLGFPQATTDHMYLRKHKASSSKEGRRQAIREKHNVVMVFGDNLNDHSDDFRRKSMAERKKAVDKHGDKFGTSFIVLPNTMYGEWEGAIYSGNWRASEQEKVMMRKKALKYWKP